MRYVTMLPKYSNAYPIFSQDNVLLGMALTMGFIPDDATEIVRLADCLMAKVITIPL
ncbi:hypothetical protein [Serratia sp. 2723]|uniref:hypothetical protein n=1 Tax=unclassified Serratia (in: enterobacteria) TaxID=2647522 RepID=UPI003D245826